MPAYGAIPPGQRVYAIGDIHGRVDLLEKLLQYIKDDIINYQGDIHLVCLGDYINRGPHSAQVIDILLKLPSAWKPVFIKGNHEWAMLEFLVARRPDWLAWGGDTTLTSYGIALVDKAHQPRPLDALIAEFTHALQQRGHLQFFQQLKLWHRIGGYGFVHGGVRRGLPLEDQLEIDLIFLRPQEFAGHDLPERIVVGHTILEEPIVEPDHIAIDTGAYKTNKLTAAVLENDTVRFLQT